MRHVWSGQHDGCDACTAFWPTRSITAREALERWPAPVPTPVRSRHAPTTLPQELAVLLPEGDTTGAPKTPSKGAKKSGTSNTVFRDSRAGRAGRPRVSADEQKRKARERQRRLRQVRKTA